MAPLERKITSSLMERVGSWWSAEARAPFRHVPITAALYRAFFVSMVALSWRLDGTSAVGALSRLWAWQLWRRLTGRPIIVKCADGSRLYAPAWSRMAGLVAAAGLTEPDDARFALDFLRPGDLFIDVGANIGFYSVLAARRGASVKAFEPTPDARAVLERNAFLNGVECDVSVREAACGSASGSARFTIGLDIDNHLASADDPSAVAIEMTTLDQEVSDAVTGQLMLKVDAEGHEVEVLGGAGELISKYRPVVLVEVYDGGRSIRNVLSGHGYQSYKYDPRHRRLFQVSPGPRGQGNLLFIADAILDEVTRRVQEGTQARLRVPTIQWRLAQTT